MNLTRRQLIKHCRDAIEANKYLIVRYYDHQTGLNPNLVKFVEHLSYLDPNKEVKCESIIKQCGINEYINHKPKHSFTGKLLNLK